MREMKILIETEARVEVSASGQVVDEWCQACHSPVDILSTAAAAMPSGGRAHAVDRCLEAGRFDGVETASRTQLFPRTQSS